MVSSSLVDFQHSLSVLSFLAQSLLLSLRHDNITNAKKKIKIYLINMPEQLGFFSNSVFSVFMSKFLTLLKTREKKI